MYKLILKIDQICIPTTLFKNSKIYRPVCNVNPQVSDVYLVTLPLPDGPLLTLIPTNNCSETCGQSQVFLPIEKYVIQLIDRQICQCPRSLLS